MSDETIREFAGLVYHATGSDLDGDTPKEWGFHAVVPTEYALDAVRDLRVECDEAESQNQALQERAADEKALADKALASLDRMQERAEKAEAALHEIEPIQGRTLAMLRREGFKFETPLDLSEGWEKLAFTLYSTICEVDAIARNALSPTQETDPE